MAGELLVDGDGLRVWCHTRWCCGRGAGGIGVT
jgi:hypothetical protein